MFNFFKKFFAKQTPTFTLGAFESPKDNRTIPASAFQPQVKLPDDFETEMTAVRNQGSVSKCVGSAITEVGELYYKRKGIDVSLSDDDLYEQCKKQDGIPDLEGTYPLIGAKIACMTGIATVEAYDSKDKKKIAESRALHKLGGFGYVTSDFYSICQSIFQSGAVTGSFVIDPNWFIGKIMRVFKQIGRHYTVLHGFNIPAQKLKGMNSWGIEWIGYIAGIFNNKVKPGHFEVAWGDIENGGLAEIFAFADVPPELIEAARSKPYEFTTTLRYGSTGYEVAQLQKALGLALQDGKWGNGTDTKFREWQRANNLTDDGVFGPMSRSIMNKRLKK